MEKPGAGISNRNLILNKTKHVLFSLDGAKGYPGDVGYQGAPGTPGLDGLVGLQGERGEEGVQGEIGEPGKNLECKVEDQTFHLLSLHH